jgi:hypothetical protein
MFGGASMSSVGCGLEVHNCVSVFLVGYNIANAASHGLALRTQCTSFVLKALNISGCQGSAGDVTEGSTSINIEGGKYTYNLLDGIHADETSSVTVGGVDCLSNSQCGVNLLGARNKVSMCTLNKNGSHGANVDNFASISDCTIEENQGDGINLVTANRCSIMGCLIESNVGASLRISGNENTITSNTMIGNADGIIVESGSLRNTLTANIIRESTNGTYYVLNGTETEIGMTHLRMARSLATTDTGYGVGKVWIDTANKNVQITMGLVNGAQTWLGGYSSVSPARIVSSSASASTGTAVEWARADHVHAMPSDLKTYDIVASVKEIATADSPYTLTASDLLSRQVTVNADTDDVTIVWPSPADIFASCHSHFYQGLVVGASWIVSFTRSDANGFGVIEIETQANVDLVGVTQVPHDASFRIRWTNVTSAETAAYTVYRIS